jgi:hypothetical protein
MRTWLFSLIFILIIAAGGGYMAMNRLVTQAVEVVGSKVLATSVTLDDSKISLFSGKGALWGLTIHNPQGFSEEPVFVMQRIDVVLDMMSLLSDTVVIKEITLVSPALLYEVQVRGHNMGALLAQVKQEDSSSPSKKLIIETLHVTDGKVTVVVDLLGQKSKKQVALPHITMTDIGGTEGGVTVDVAATTILSSLMQHFTILDEVVKDGQKDALKQQIDRMKKSVKDIF